MKHTPRATPWVHAPSRTRPTEFTACGERLSANTPVYNESQCTCPRCRKAVREESRRDVPLLSYPPCGTCAFVDATAFRDDAQLAAKLKHCVTTGTPFYCHQRGGMQTDAEGKHIPPTNPDGSVDTTQLLFCVGWLHAIRREGARGRGMLADWHTQSPGPEGPSPKESTNAAMDDDAAGSPECVRGERVDEEAG